MGNSRLETATINQILDVFCDLLAHDLMPPGADHPHELAALPDSVREAGQRAIHRRVQAGKVVTAMTSRRRPRFRFLMGSKALGAAAAAELCRWVAQANQEAP
jgi:hypothetical protein